MSKLDKYPKNDLAKGIGINRPEQIKELGGRPITPTTIKPSLKWKMRRFLNSLKSSITGIPRSATIQWYRIVHGITIGSYDSTMVPRDGKGKYVDIHLRGKIYDIVCHDLKEIPPGVIRLVPDTGMFGFYVEFIDHNGNNLWRTHVSAEDFYNMNDNTAEMESGPQTCMCPTTLSQP